MNKVIKSLMHSIQEDFEDVQMIHHEINGLFQDKLYELETTVSEQASEDFQKQFQDQIQDLDRAESDICEAEGWISEIEDILDLSDGRKLDEAENGLIANKLANSREVIDNARRLLGCRGFFSRHFSNFTDAIGYNY